MDTAMYGKGVNHLPDEACVCVRHSRLTIFTSTKPVSSQDWSGHPYEFGWRLPYMRSIDAVRFYYTAVYVDVGRFCKSYWFFICCFRRSLITYFYVCRVQAYYHFLSIQRSLNSNFYVVIFFCESQQFHGVMDGQLPSIPLSYIILLITIISLFWYTVIP